MAHPNIYVIDDEQAMLDSTAFLLRAARLNCACFNNPMVFLAGLEALEPGCILTDLRMPGMNGFELQSALRERAPGWPIVLMTSENGTLTDETVATRGFTGFLRKPFAAAALLSAIAACGPAVERLRRQAEASDGH